MARKFKTEIVTPEKILFSEDIESLVIPAERGYLGVLAMHAPLLCTLKPGAITIKRSENDVTYFSTSGGFLEVSHGKAVLLTESAEEAKSIDIARAQEAKQRAEERLAASAPKDIDKERAKAALERAENRLQIAKKYGK